MLTLLTDYARTPDYVGISDYARIPIMWEPLNLRISLSGHRWTPKVFNTVITLGTYNFLLNLHTLVFLL